MICAIYINHISQHPLEGVTGSICIVQYDNERTVIEIKACFAGDIGSSCECLELFCRVIQCAHIVDVVLNPYIIYKARIHGLVRINMSSTEVQRGASTPVMMSMIGLFALSRISAVGIIAEQIAAGLQSSCAAFSDAAMLTM